MTRPRQIARMLNPLTGTKAALRRFRHTDAGQSLVEFAMVLPFFLVLLFALVDFGRAFYTWLLVTNAAREGARAGAVQLDSTGIDGRIYSSLCKTYPTDCSLDMAKLTTTPKTGVQGPRGSSVSVTVSYAFEYVTPLGSMLAILPGGADSIATPTISGYSSMRLE